ncbi:uncharacterized protein VTP21DRAFT_5053 [Calcarisporiella thermophila]|uniref:uncharacterized protein n=1 Tax=Calcarisporiella thermophila TaxID=911321 RepID=UPI003742716E
MSPFTVLYLMAVTQAQWLKSQFNRHRPSKNFPLNLFMLLFFVLISLYIKATAERASKRHFQPNNSSTRVLSLSRVSYVDPATSQFIDAAGRSVIFHGTNVVYKSPPFHPWVDKFDVKHSFSEEDAKILSELNVNMIRLGVMWVGVEPQKGKYDEKYLEAIRKIVEHCAKYGIFVLLDSHQDVLTEQFCGGGAPGWIVHRDWVLDMFKFPFPIKSPYKVNGSYIPSDKDCGSVDWFQYYTSAAVANAFGHWYRNDDGLADAFAAQWARIAQIFGKYDNVIGYDLLNEPWAGDTYANPGLLVPGVADKTTLEPFYNRIHKEIRKHDQDSIVFIEGVTWDIEHGFNDVPGGPHWRNKTGLSYHYYAPPQVSLDITMKSRMKDLKRLHCGGILSEFTQWWIQDPAERKKLTLDVQQAADRYMQSYLGWVYKSFAQGGGYSLFDESTGKARPEMERLYSRTFAPAVAGKILGYNFNDDDYSFHLEYNINAKATLPTVIKIQKRVFYTKGYKLNISPPSWAKSEEIDSNTIHIVHTKEAKDGEKLTVTLTKL